MPETQTQAKELPPLVVKEIAAGVRAVAFFEALKGTLVLVAGFGLLSLVHRDLQDLAERLVSHSHLNPASHYPRVFVEAAARTSDARLRMLAALAFAYSSVRFVEAYGLWRMRAWAEWFAIISGCIYLPLEAYELFERATFIRAGILAVNAFIVAYLLYVRFSRTGREAEEAIHRTQADKKAEKKAKQEELKTQATRPEDI
ncbi:MAG TPA: DUF2127 domain-containing protein [Pyrinomonadaceae bacterium]|jgi:uncharacterized membrane protein (DUF2068 family)|nr:DUF2127 domain-containing protein [Pyrinomonadaceae bacterium]